MMVSMWLSSLTTGVEEDKAFEETSDSPNTSVLFPGNVEACARWPLSEINKIDEDGPVEFHDTATELAEEKYNTELSEIDGKVVFEVELKPEGRFDSVEVSDNEGDSELVTAGNFMMTVAVSPGIPSIVSVVETLPSEVVMVVVGMGRFIVFDAV